VSGLDAILENRLLDGWWRHLRRSQTQLNAVHQADAELVPLPGGDLLLALTTDTVAEEIALGFYRDPETIGWMAATVSLSDLAAVGARPLGLLVAVTLPPAADAALQEGLARGLDAACQAAGTFVLGGDTNSGASLSLTTTAAGLVPVGKALLRTGCKPGDDVLATGLLGSGAVCAAAAALPLPPGLADEAWYRPRARIALASQLAGRVSACMDTSDGLIATLDQLGRLNDVGINVELPAEELLEPRARRLCAALALDPLVALAQIHGEFELIITAQPGQRRGLEEMALASGTSLIRLGQVVREPGVRFTGRCLDTAALRNLHAQAGLTAQEYFTRLVAHLR
jgi:thiamine-monophosphate kinase